MTETDPAGRAPSGRICDACHSARARIRAHIRSNVVGYIAIFLFATSGTAVALNGSNTVFSDDLVNGEVKTADLRAGAVTGGRLAPDSIRGGKVVDESLGGIDILDGSIGRPELSAGSVDGDSVADGSLTGAEVADNSLRGADVDEASLGEVAAAALGGTGRSSGVGSCDPESATFATCASVDVSRSGPGSGPARALVIGRIAVHNEQSADSGVGSCRLRSSGSGPIAGTTQQVLAEDGHAFIRSSEYLTLVGLTPPLNPSAQTFTIECNQDSGIGAIQYDGASVAAVLISAD